MLSSYKTGNHKMLTKDKLFSALEQIEDPAKKRLVFTGILSKEIVASGGKKPIIVGGEAVEIYTQGSYTTGDIDIKTSPEIMEEILGVWGFEKVKGSRKIWFNEALDIYLDWQGTGLDEGPEAEKRVNSIRISGDMDILVISFEDLITDRLCAAKFWKDTDSKMWAKALFEIARETGKVDIIYLRKRAEKENVSDLLNNILKNSSIDKNDIKKVF